jgi:uncharacterized protein YdeI (YjbR/CyaY-like superfamily)
MDSYKDIPVLFFESQDDWERWLSVHYTDPVGVWLKFYKKGSGVPSLTYKLALDVALCYGWIDSMAKSMGDDWYIQRFSPRRPKSIWSKVNREHIARLIEEGRMRPPGLAEVERAKADGRWEAAYDGPRNAQIPDDVMDEIRKHPEALATFETLNKTNRYYISFYLQTAKKPETRQRRIHQMVDTLKRGEKFH